VSIAIEQPLSWLTLERYVLGELDEEARLTVEARLAVSAEDRACLQTILQDESALPPLPVVLPARRREKARRTVLVRVSAAVALAASLLLVVLLRPPDAPIPARRELRSGAKGGEISVRMLSDRRGEGPSSFAPGERFKVLVTTPPWFEAPLSVVVFQGSARYTPLPAVEALPRGNLVPWPSAFTLSGEEAVQVCVTWSPDAATARTPEALGEDAVCAPLQPR
jgi:hypothetical protein